ncbi:precorrin-8X methylmutase [Pelotomaculum isophthalicicum JI]|uniref:Precorrin-8X methylmutase n=1 Tax=Pelotomaculum isophthalicicum JI TaxID=947010 RepID=A0A9X4H2H7_9FIRM|nr:precorrin-8X methylmutase [Pelotomaculum isophthalicicum]MDF9408850.1 precorrin-8X methylmutase [Pelotomaculum isophthalicicum JI]
MAYLYNPQAIEARSYELIAAELGDCRLTAGEKAVLFRIIHATGDLSYARLISFHPEFITAAVAALKRGAGIFTDIEMVRAGISSRLVDSLGGKIFCAIREPEVAAEAKIKNVTRAMAAMEWLARRMDGGLVVIGNAPTALFRLLELMEAEVARPAAVIGVPVGFVGAAEAKEALAVTSIPHVVVRGTKGGSPVAVAAVNALLKLAVE